MEFTAVVAALLRRWYVVLVGLVMTAGLVYVAHDAVPPTYSATGSVLLLPPGTSVADGSNALLSLGGLEQPAALVVAYLAGDDARHVIAEDFPNATYDIVLDPLSRGPLVLVTVHDPDQGDVMSALDGVLAALPEALDMLQDQVDAPADSRVTSMPLSVDTLPTTERSDSLRALIAAAGVGMVLTLVGAVAFDALAARRRERRRAAASMPDVEEQEATVVAPAAPAEPELEVVVPEAAAAPEAEPAVVEANEAEPVSSPTGASHLKPQDFDRPEERYGSHWPPQALDEPTTRDDELHIIHRG